MPNNKLWGFALILVAVLTAYATAHCQSLEPNNVESQVKLVYAEVNPMNSYSAFMARIFKERVEDLSLGNIQINLKVGGELGNDNEVLSSIYQGKGPDLIRTSVSYLQDYGANKAAMLSTPYVFKNREHFWNFMSSRIKDDILNELSYPESHFKGLCFFEEGFRHFFSKKQISCLSQLEGLKIRSARGYYFDDLIKIFNGTSVRVPFKDMTKALKEGTIDGGEQPLLNYYSSEAYKFAPNIILDGHVLALSELVISSSTWNKLTKAQQNIITRAAKYVERVNKVNIVTQENNALRSLKKAGVRVTTVEDNSIWEEKCSELIFKTTKAYSALYNQIQKLK